MRTTASIALLVAVPSACVGVLGGGPVLEPPGLEVALEHARTALRRSEAASEAWIARGELREGEQALPWSLRFDGSGRFELRRGAAGEWTSGFDGERAWEADVHGVRVQSRAAAAAGLARALVLAGPWAGPTGTGSANLDPVRIEGERSGYAFVLGDGAETRLVVDGRTWLPRELTWPSKRGEGRDSYSDWREVGCGRFPHRVVRRRSPGRTRTIVVESVRRAEGNGASFAAPAHRSPGGPIARRVRGYADAVPCARAPRGQVLVRARLDGVDAGWFLLDTASEATLLAPRVADENGLTPGEAVPLIGVAGGTLARRLAEVRLGLGPLELEGIRPLVTDLDALEDGMGLPLAGVLGYDVLARAVVRIDPRTPTVEVFPAGGIVPGDEDLPWRSLVFDDRQPLVPGRIEDVEGLFVLDTGSDGGLILHRDLSRELLADEDPEHFVPARVRGLGGSSFAVRATLPSFELADRRWEDLRATLYVEGRGAFAHGTALGNVGCGLLAEFDLVLDYPAGRIALRRHGAPRRADR